MLIFLCGKKKKKGKLAMRGIAMQFDSGNPKAEALLYCWYCNKLQHKKVERVPCHKAPFAIVSSFHLSTRLLFIPDSQMVSTQR